MTSADEESIEEIAAGFDDKSESTSPELVRKVRFLAGAGHTPTVIIAHRERWFREALVALFANDGWAAMETHSAGELTELVRAIYPHVALVDPALLELSGSAASELLRAHRADNSLRVVALLGEVDPSANLEELTSGYDDFVYHLDNPAEVVVRARRNLAACRATRESHQQRSDLSSLLQLSQTLASSLDLNLILHTVSRLLAEVIEFERCSIVLLDPEGQGALMVAASEDRTVRDLRIAVSNYPEMQRCIETGRPVYVDESVSEVELLPLVEKMRASGVRLAALFPIIFEERVTGVLFLRSSIGGRTLTEREKRYGQTVASACAVAVRNARLFDSVRDQHERMNSMRLVAERQMEALKRYEDFFEYAADGMAIVDSDGAILYVNREGRRAIGRQQEELRGVRFASLMVGESTNMWERIIEQVREGRFRRSFDLYIQHGDGSERIFWLSAGGVGQDTGLIVLSFRDVTETREMELELRTTKEFLENLIDNSVDAIVAADMSGNVMLFNKGAEQIFGYHAEEVVGRLRLEQLYPHGVVEEVMTQLRDERFGGRGRLDGSRKSVLDSRGRIVPVSMTASIIYEDGEEVATVGTFTDLRDRIEMEQRLSEAEEELMKTERARVAAELAGMAAHELNQPLTSVLGYAEMLRYRVQEDARVSKVVETIYTQAERMAEIVRKIGNITRYETKVYGAKTMMMDLERSTGSGEGSGGMTPSPGPSNLAGGVRVAGLQPILPGDVVTSAASRNDHPTDPRYAIIRADTIDDERTGPMPRVQVSPPPQERASGTGPSHTESPAAEPGHGSPVTPSTLPSPKFLRSAAIFEDLSADNPPEHERTNHEGLPLLRRNEPPPKD